MTDEIFPGGLSILSLNPRITEEYMDDELKQTLVLNGYTYQIIHHKRFSNISLDFRSQKIGQS